jgi:hypothetical protein
MRAGHPPWRGRRYTDAVFAMGVPELAIIALIGLLLFAAPIAVFIWLLKQRKGPPPPPGA